MRDFRTRFGAPPVRALALSCLLLVPSVACAQAADVSPQGRDWASIAKLPDFTGSWAVDRFRSLNQNNDPIPLKAPYDKIMADLRRVTQSPNGDVPSNSKLCVPNGPVMVAPTRLYEFLFTPGQVTIIPQNNEVRRIYTDGRGHPKNPTLTFLGDSIGHWEAGTLVIETVGLRRESEFIHAFRTADANKTVTMVERVSLTDSEHMKIVTTLDSPVVFSAPFSFTATYTRVPFPVLEEICTQNNMAVDPLTGDQKFPDAPTEDGTVPPPKAR